MNNNGGSSLLCLIGCVVFGLIAGGLSWYLLQTVVSAWTLPIIAGFVAIVTIWMLHEALCKGQAKEQPSHLVAGAAAGGAAMAAAVDNNNNKKEPEVKTAPKPASKAKPAKSASKSKSAKAKSDGAPKLYTKRPSKVDDLKMIAGVGPKLEGVLHDVGVYQFEQIASWKKKDIAYVDERLKFKGRIEREQWVKQAKALVKGGEAEYIKVFGKKPR